MGGVDYRRRATLAMLAGIAITPRAAFAQDPRGAIVQKVARDWLALADDLNGTATWSSAGARFQQALTVDKWTAALRRQREPRGATVQRAVVSTTFGSKFRGLPAGGSYALVQFRTSYANGSVGGDDVTLELGSDNAWRVIGYVIR
jgi:hypothetical protein